MALSFCGLLNTFFTTKQENSPFVAKHDFYVQVTQRRHEINVFLVIMFRKPQNVLQISRMLSKLS